jgi:hypothetical protein
VAICQKKMCRSTPPSSHNKGFDNPTYTSHPTASPAAAAVVFSTRATES